MGIPGLTRFIEKFFTGWEVKEIRSDLVIDGDSLIAYLYHGLNPIGVRKDVSQYPQFREAILKFLQTLKESDIHPKIVLGKDYKQSKKPSLVESRQRKIQTNYQKGIMLPVLAHNVFKETLLELGVPLLVADGEADIAVCHLANHYSCPVLADDSDYYMFNLKGGYIQIKHFDLKASPIEAKLFHAEAFTKQFKHADVSLRLIIPTIFGNDFLYRYRSPQLNRHIGVKTSLRPDHHGFSTVTKYASQFTNLGEFATLISHSSSLLTNCEESVRYYDSKVTASFDQLRDPTMTELCKCSGERIPEWLMREFRDGHVSTFVMDSLVLGKYIKSDGVYALCKPLRQYIYGLLGVESVEEHARLKIRKDGAVNHVSVHAVCSLNGQPLPTLDQVTKLDLTVRKVLLYSMLGCNPVEIERLPEEWRLVAASVVFWANKAKDITEREVKAENITEREVKALLYTLVLCLSKSPNLDPCALKRQTQVHRYPKPELKTVVYFYTEWQCCYLTAENLNVLLMKPLQYISPALLYDGQTAANLHFTRHVPVLDEMQKQLYLNLCSAVSAHTLLQLDPHHKEYPEGTKTSAKYKKEAGASGSGASGMVQKSKKKTSKPKSHKYTSTFEHPNPFALLSELDPDP